MVTESRSVVVWGVEMEGRMDYQRQQRNFWGEMEMSVFQL